MLQKRSEESCPLGNWWNMCFLGHSCLPVLNTKWTRNRVSISLSVAKTFSTYECFELDGCDHSAVKVKEKYWQHVDRKILKIKGKSHCLRDHGKCYEALNLRNNGPIWANLTSTVSAIRKLPFKVRNVSLHCLSYYLDMPRFFQIRKCK